MINLFQPVCKYIFILQLLFYSIAPALLLGQENIRFDHIAVEDGLSRNTVLCILQDREGFMWFGTREGLNKYDGYQFTVYKRDIYDSTSISDNWISTMMEDQSGNLWVGTMSGGLNKYHKKTGRFTRYNNFTIVTRDSGHYNPLLYIKGLLEDSGGKIWILTRAVGLTRFDPQQKTLTYYRRVEFGDDSGISDFTINSILEDSRNTIWIATGGGGLNRFNKKDNSFSHFGHDPENPNSLSHNTLNSIYEDREGNLWIATEGGGMSRYDPIQNRFTNYLHDPQNNSGISSNFVNRICPDPRKGNELLWISTGVSGLSLFNKRAQTFTHILRDNRALQKSSWELTRLQLDGKGNLWMINREQDLLKITTKPAIKSLQNPGGGKANVTLFKNDPLNHKSIGGNTIITSYEDRNGIIWFGTASNGISLYDPAKYKFPHYTLKVDNKNNAVSTSIRAIRATGKDSSEVLWLGTLEEGLFEYNRRTGQYRQYRHDPGVSDALPSNYISAIIEDDNGFLWIGTWNGLVRASPGQSGILRFVSYQKVTGDENSLSDNRVLTIYKDSDSILWIGTMNGLNRFDPKTSTFQRYLYHRYYAKGTPANLVYSMYEDRFGYLWVGTANGLVRLDRYKEPAESYIDHNYICHDPDNPRESLSNDWIFAIYEDLNSSSTLTGDRQVLWIGTSGGGLNKMILPSGYSGSESERIEFEHYTDKNGLPANSISAILGDDFGNLWISSKRGLTKFTPSIKGEGAFKNYDVDDGTQSNVFYLGSYHKSSSGELFFGGENGFNSFYPDSINDNRQIPRVVLTNFKVFDQSRQTGSEPILNLELTYKENFFSLEFAALSYSNISKNHYRYKLEGFDKTWIDNGTRRSAHYTNVPPGMYIFRVKASNGDDVWSEEGLTIHINIAPPFWSTWWFRIFLAAFFIMALLATHRYRIRKINNQKARLEKLVKARTTQLEQQKTTIEQQAQKLREMDRVKRRLFANISHEFRTPLMLISGPLEELASNGFDAKTGKLYQVMRRNSQRLMHLIDQLLDLARFESGDMKLNLTASDLIVMAKEIVLSFAPLAEQKNIKLSLHTNDKPLHYFIDKDKFEKILYNLLSNAFKFTPEGGSVSVAVSMISDFGFRVSENYETEIRSGASLRENRKSEIDNFVEITVRDTGIGIPQETLPHIFDRFYQVAVNSNNGKEGTGIGLALVKELVALHQGQISVNSQVKQGTEFIVRLPLDKSQSAESRGQRETDELPSAPSPNPFATINNEQKSTGNGQPTTNNDHQILIIEDNIDVRTYLRNFLSPNYQIIEAINGSDGIRKAGEHVPDLIISDIMMPQQDGFEVCRLLKNDEKTSHIPIILLTAKAGPENKLEGLETGADDYLTKPFDKNELCARVENLIEQRRRLRKKFRRQMVLQPNDVEVTPLDQAFLQKVCSIIESHLEETEFGADSLRIQLGMSKAQYHRKIYALTDQSPSQLIRSMRLKRAKQLLEKRAGNISEIAFAVGFNNLSYFSKCFRAQFGKLPSEMENKC